MKDWYKYAIGFIEGTMTMVVLDLMPTWPPFPVAIWGDVSDWVMIGVTIVLAVFAALLPARLQKLTAHNTSKRYVLAILNEYEAALEKLEEFAAILREDDTHRFVHVKKDMFLCQLYEQTRQAAAQHDSFLELEALRSRLVEIENALSHPPRPPDKGDEPWNPEHDCSDSSYNKQCNELADKVDAVVSEFRSFRNEVEAW